jgi:hypothetical protein
MVASSPLPTPPCSICRHSPSPLDGPFFPQLTNSALLSISQFCDHGFEARFNSKTVRIMRGNHEILEGSRDSSTGLWQLGLQPGTLPQTTQLVHQPDNQPTTNNVHELAVKQDIVTYLHRACFSPVPSTWLKAIDAGHFATWPGLTIDLRSWRRNCCGPFVRSGLPLCRPTFD